MKPSGEFRCFVRGRRLVGVCQRHCSDHFPFLGDDVPRTGDQLREFHARVVAPAFPQTDCACGDCVVCVCVCVWRGRCPVKL